MGISVALEHEGFLPSRFRNLNSPHRKTDIIVGTPIGEYIVHKVITKLKEYQSIDFRDCVFG